MSQELIERLRSEAETFEPGSFAQTMLLKAADTIQYLLDVADDVNQALREQIGENERLKSDIKRKDESLDYARTIMADNERLKAELEAAIKDIMCLDHCDVCVHSRERNWSCEAADFDCLVCKDENCTCRGCRDENKWQWRGVKRKDGDGNG